MICPIMSTIVRSRFKGVTDSTTKEDLLKVDCLEKECAFWAIEMRDGQIYQERCGVIK